MSGFGKYLKEYLISNNVSQSEFATRLGITQKHMNELLNGKKNIDIEMAINIEKLTSIPISFIINAEHRKRVTEDILKKYKDEKTLDKILKDEYSLKELSKRKWVDFQDITNPIQNYMDIIKFLKVKDFNALNMVQEKTLFKKTGTDLNKLNLWIARADELSKTQEVNEYDSSNFYFMVEDILKIAYKNEIDVGRLQKLLNSYGIYFVVEKALSGTKVRGCFKVKEKNPAIYITQNYNGKDSFYFELFHELGHCKSDYNEAKSKIIVEGSELQEKRADDFAINTMVPKEVWEIIKHDCSEKNIKEISQRHKIPMCFIVGRLAKEKKIKYSDEMYRKYCAIN